MKYKGKIHYGWVIVLASFITMGLVWSITFNIPSLFVTSIAQDLGLSRSAINFTFTIRSIFQILVSLASAYIFSRFKIQRVMKIAAIIFTLATLLHSQVGSIGGIYLCTVFISLTCFLLTVIPLSLILNEWFNERLGEVIGIAFMGSGIFSAILSPIMGWVLTSYDWRTCYLILGILCLVLLLPAVFFFLKADPKSMGMTAYGSEEGNEERRNAGLYLAELRTDKGFWLLLIAVAFMSFGMSGLMINISPHLEDIGYSVEFASKIFAITTLTLALAKILLGKTYDKSGIRLASVLSALAILFGLVSMDLILLSDIFFVGIIVFSAYGCAFGTVGNQNIVKHMYGNKDYGSIFSYFQAASGLGSIVGPIVIGYLFDTYGSYFPSIKVGIVSMLVPISIFLLILPKKEFESYS